MIKYFIIGLIVFAVFLVFSSKLKMLFRIFLQGVFGCAAIAVCNVIFSSSGLYVGINALTVLLVSVLGVPGVVGAYVVVSLL